MNPQQHEIEKLTPAIQESTREVYEKYLKIFDWDIPENNEQRASEQILSIMQETIDRLRHSPQT